MVELFHALCAKINLPAFLRHFTEERPLLVGPTRDSESKPSSVRLTVRLDNKMAATVKTFFFFVFEPRW